MALFIKWLKAAVLVLLAGLALYAGVVLLVLWGERDRPFKDRMVGVKMDLQTLDGTVRRFNERQHRLPVSLDELSDASLLGEDEAIRLPKDPWGGSYFYEVSDAAGKQSYEIWSVPDAETQAKLGVARLTPQSDWRRWLP